MKIKAVIVEDSRLARNELLELLKPFNSIEVVASAQTVEQGIEIINQHQPNLIFLDINLPDGTGFDLLEQLDFCPSVIFTTAYDEYAFKAFELNAMDYLLKPVNAKRFEQALEKIIVIDNPNEQSIIDHKLFVKENNRCWLIDINEIRYFQSNGNYTHIHFDKFQPLIYKSLNKIQERLPNKQFFRTNRSYIVNINFIDKIENYGTTGLLLTMDDGKEIDVSRRHTSYIRNMLNL